MNDHKILLKLSGLPLIAKQRAAEPVIFLGRLNLAEKR